MTSLKKTKNYCTTSSVNNACYFRRDYSYSVNGKCLDCKFCPNKVGQNKQRLYLSKYIANEAEYSCELYSAPITISRYCEPFLNKTYANHSISVANRFIDNEAHVIFKTSIVSDDTFDYLQFNKDLVHLHLRLFNADTDVGQMTRDIIAPNRPSLKHILYQVQRASDADIDVVVEIDPLILGVNDTAMQQIIVDLHDNGCKKIIFKQLFCTDYFKAQLNKYIDGKYINILNEQVGKFWTYKNDALLYAVLPVMEKAYKLGMKISFCMNRELNDITKVLLGYDGNCCHVNNPNGVYDINANPMNRLKSQIIRNIK